MPTEKYAHAPEILEHCQRIGKQFGLYDNALFHTEVTDLEWDDDRSRVDHPHQPRRRVHRPVRRHGHRPAARAEAAGHPRHRGLPGPLVPHQPLGLRLHRRRPDRARRWTGWPTSGSAIIGTGATAVQCVPHLATACEELYVFQRTPSSVDVRDNRPDRPRVVRRRSPRPGWQQRWLENFTANQTGGMRRGGPGDGRLDRPGPPHPRQDHGAAAGRLHARGDDGGLRGLRLREDGGDPGPGRLDRRGPGHRRRASRPGTGSCASGRASTTSTCRPSTSPAPTSSTPTARASSASPRPAWWSPARSTRSTASSTPRASRWAPPYTRRAGYDLAGRDGVRLSEHWADGMRTKHGIHVHGFPNLFIVQPTQGANLISNVPHNLTEAGQDDRDDRSSTPSTTATTRSRSPRRPRTPGSSCCSPAPA